jgi:hypothetical protein
MTRPTYHSCYRLVLGVLAYAGQNLAQASLDTPATAQVETIAGLQSTRMVWSTNWTWTLLPTGNYLVCGGPKDSS